MRFDKLWLNRASPIDLKFIDTGLVLKFDKLWLNRTSPIDLKFIDTGLVLRFDAPWINSTSPIRLRFGGDVEPPLPIDNSIGIECGIRWSQVKDIERKLVLTEHAEKIAIAVDFVWSTPDVIEQSRQLHWMSFNGLEINYSPFWALKTKVSNNITVKWSQPYIHQMNTMIVWQAPNEHQLNNIIPWLNMPALQLLSSVVWQDGNQHNIEHVFRYSGLVCDAQYQTGWGPHAPRWICSTDYRPPQAGLITIRFDESLTQKESQIVIRFTPSSEYCYFDDGGGLIDANPSLPSLDFETPIEPQLRRYYLMQPTITCVRVSDDVPIVISNINISRSRGQWASSVSIDFSSRIDASRAENQLLKIGINGYEFYCLVEQLSVSKVFGNETYRGTGRSRSAELATPYVLPISYTNATSRSFAGLLTDMLQFTGWTIALNGIVDFNVPAGAFSVGNKSPIDAVQEAVAQLGCMLLSNDETKALTVVPRWPTVPWLMDGVTPDLTVHDAVITSYSESKEIGTECNVVWLRGEQQGISAKVKRAGTAGNIATDDISAQLIVDNQAARIAGTNALADTGNKLNINMSLPIMADLPPVTPGMLIGVREGAEVYKGICDSASISASISDNGDIDISQSITVIRHVA
ncbi:hypothetical protein [Shewanella sp. T24-MNA-CIBAN-0130]|uniref:hypothetical protein n=1 Tax=Shewanella sp. T24-MNA-CIBAN-0130 TaxID=3140470 RepID=UPI00332BFCFB